MLETRSLFGRDALPPHSGLDGLRRDAAFIWNIIVTLIFVCFAGLAVASAILDLVSIRQ